MAYKIEPKTVKEFIDMDTCLPRFQRKQTWKPKDNFKLCISVFKDYPVGVVIINNNSGKNWVLDGRQRLNALSRINRNPRDVYDWARSFIGFKNADADDVVKKMYWDKIDDYLQKDFEEDVYNDKDYDKRSDISESSSSEIVDEDEASDVTTTGIEFSYNKEEQKNNLNILLKYILMVHNIKSGKSKFERTYDFSKLIKKLDYYKVIDGKTTFVESNLVKMINSFISKSKEESTKELINIDQFVKYFIDERYIDEDDTKLLKKFYETVELNWENIKDSFDIIDKVNTVLSNSRIGLIEITQASDLDAQNMFSLVNTGGTLLTAEEILSAKPFWNKAVINPSKDCIKSVDSLYEILKVERPDNVVRWDLCATLLSRIDKSGVIFENRHNDSFASQTTLGFKLVSAILLNGISSAVVSKLEKETDFDWDTDYEILINDLNNLIDVISQHNYFKTMKSWKQSLMGITSNTIALEFITIMYKRWCSIGKTTVDSAETKRLRREAVILMDKLIYEYSNKMWRGSSDSKLANDVNPDNINERLKEVSEDSWLKLIGDMSKGFVNDQPCTMNLVKPILFHSKFLNGELSPITSDSFDMDHIYPQKLFKSNNSLDQNLKDSLINLQILSSKSNEQKNDKKINEIFDVTVLDEISKSSYIDAVNNPAQYSDINNISELQEFRLKHFNNIFTKSRGTMINN